LTLQKIITYTIKPFLLLFKVKDQEALMKILEHIKGKSLLVLIAGIIILCVGFVIISCGDPELKTTDSKKGQCAIDFTRKDTGRTLFVTARNASFPSITGKELTVEAWIKPKTAPSSTSSGIFGRYDSRGVKMSVQENYPEFTIRVLVGSTSTAGTSTAPEVDYMVRGPVALAQNVWHHIVGVLVNDDHTNTSGDGDVHGSCEDDSGNPVDGADEKPHLDLYVNGHFVNCAKTWGDPDDTAGGPQFVSDPFIAIPDADANLAAIGYNPNTYNEQFEGVIDEVRLWTVARTSADIYTCMGRELSTSGGDCGINTDILKGYWRFNECEHDKTMDWSGAGSSGFITDSGGHEWDDGWVEGVRGVNGDLLPMD
jgi:hypothetical protein